MGKNNKQTKKAPRVKRTIDTTKLIEAIKAKPLTAVEAAKKVGMGTPYGVDKVRRALEVLVVVNKKITSSERTENGGKPGRKPLQYSSK